ncbi:MAG: Smr/MutS family protein [Adhaeribacter sp.]
MNIGDRVRLLHGREEGIITRFIGKDQVEIAIDNDFTIPVMRREVVVVAAEENKFFGDNSAAEPAPAKNTIQPSAPVLSAAGLYVALAHQSPELLSVHIVNNTDYDLLFTYGEEVNGRYKGLASDKLTPKAAKVVGHLHLKDFEKWPDLVLQFLQHHSMATSLLEPGLHRIKFKASSFYKSKKVAPVLKKEAYVFPVDVKPTAIDLQQLQDKLAESAAQPGNFALEVPAHEVDLHIEKLTDRPASAMSNSEMLKLQLQVFQDNLDRALAANMHEIIFIHGTGNGVLRQELHKLLSRNKLIRFYEDAQKEKFGYGATLVRLK